MRGGELAEPRRIVRAEARRDLGPLAQRAGAGAGRVHEHAIEAAGTRAAADASSRRPQSRGGSSCRRSNSRAELLELASGARSVAQSSPSAPTCSREQAGLLPAPRAGVEHPLAGTRAERERDELRALLLHDEGALGVARELRGIATPPAAPSARGAQAAPARRSRASRAGRLPYRARAREPRRHASPPSSASASFAPDGALEPLEQPGGALSRTACARSSLLARRRELAQHGVGEAGHARAARAPHLVDRRVDRGEGRDALEHQDLVGGDQQVRQDRAIGRCRAARSASRRARERARGCAACRRRARWRARARAGRAPACARARRRARPRRTRRRARRAASARGRDGARRARLRSRG